MSTAVQTRKEAIPAFAMSEAELMGVLRNSLYPGAQDESIKMVVSYCKAAGLDPMQKPVHIVPMWDSKAQKMRDVIMPGIGSYRTQAARSGEYAGVTEPEFGPDVTEKIGGQEITYPAWCRVVVKRLLPNGMVAEFATVERWKENYAQKGGKEKSVAPNAMWTKRPYGQLAKCTEAQGLRKAFPEFGAQPTADEMEGREYAEGATIDGATGEVVESGKKELPAYADDKFDKSLTSWKEMIDAGKTEPDRIIAKVSSSYKLTDDQIAKIRALASQEKAAGDGVAAAAEPAKDPFVAEMEAAEKKGGAQ